MEYITGRFYKDFDRFERFELMDKWLQSQLPGHNHNLTPPLELWTEAEIKAIKI
jgi:hypothetical protein